MAVISRENNNFKRSVYISISIHIALFLLILLSPYLPKSESRGMIHYVNVISLGGGGGGGGGGGQPEAAVTELSETQVPQRERLQDLSTPQKIEQQKPPAMTYPVENPKRDKAPDTPKKAIIKKSPTTKTKQKATSQSGPGSGRSLGIGIGNGTGSSGTGFGPGFGSGTGLSNVPYAYFLQNLSDSISSEWMTAQIRTGLSGEYHTVVQFKIYRDGRISDPDIKERSGVRTMDMSAVRAIRNAAPFPPLPREYEDEYMQIILYFEHKK